MEDMEASASNDNDGENGDMDVSSTANSNSFDFENQAQSILRSSSNRDKSTFVDVENDLEMQVDEKKDVDLKARSIKYIELGQYKEAFTCLTSNSDEAKDALLSIVKTSVQKEVTRVTENCHVTNLAKPLSNETLASTEWAETRSDIRQKMPFFHACIDAAMPSTSSMLATENPVQTEDERISPSLTEREAQTTRDQQLCHLASLILHHSAPSVYSFTQACLGVEMYIQGASDRLFQTLQTLGVSTNKKNSEEHAKKLMVGYDERLLKLKHDQEKQPTQKQGLNGENITHTSSDPEPAGFSFTLNRIKFEALDECQKKTADLKTHTNALAIAAVSRIKSSDPTELVNGPTKAANLGPEVFIPSSDDYSFMHSRMSAMVARILVQYCKALEGLKEHVEWHIPHAKSTEMTEKSEVINLGMLEGEIKIPEDTIDALDKLAAYVPLCEENGITCPVPVLGVDNSAVTNSKAARCTSHNPRTSFQCLIEGPQETHKDQVLVQNLMKELYDRQSSLSPGSLANLKAVLWHTHQDTDAEFIEFATDFYTLLLTLQLAEMDTLDSVPKGFPSDTSTQEQATWLSQFSDRLVEFVSTKPDLAKLEDATKGYVAQTRGWYRSLEEGEEEDGGWWPHCFCQEVKSKENVVRCCNRMCPVQYVHYCCAKEKLYSEPREDWFCSKDCEQSKHYLYCYCQTKRDPKVKIVRCGRKEKCSHFQRYHLECLALEENDIPGDFWYCSPECTSSASPDDRVQAYSARLVDRCLQRRARCDAVSEGDADAMLTFWRLDLVEFVVSGNKTCLELGHRLLAFTHGFLPPKIAHDLKWNRVANLTGQPGANVGLDAVNDVINKDLRDLMLRNDRRATLSHIQQCSQIGVFFEKEMSRLSMYGTTKVDAMPEHLKEKSEEFIADIKQEINFLKDADLFMYKPKRCHCKFEDFQAPQLSDGFVFGQTLKKMSNSLDLKRRLRQDENRSHFL